MSACGCNLLKNNTKVNYNLTRVFTCLPCLSYAYWIFLPDNKFQRCLEVVAETEHTISTFRFSRISAGKNWVKMNYVLDG